MSHKRCQITTQSQIISMPNSGWNQDRSSCAQTQDRSSCTQTWPVPAQYSKWLETCNSLSVCRQNGSEFYKVKRENISLSCSFILLIWHNNRIMLRTINIFRSAIIIQYFVYLFSHKILNVLQSQGSLNSPYPHVAVPSSMCQTTSYEKKFRIG